MSGRCRKAASTRARSLYGRAARADEETNIKLRRRSSPRSRSGSTYDLRRRSSGKSPKGKYRGQKQKWFALLLHRRRQRDRHRDARGRTQAGVRRMAMGSDAGIARARRAVQAQVVRARRERILEVRRAAEKAVMLERNQSFRTRRRRDPNPDANPEFSSGFSRARRFAAPGMTAGPSQRSARRLFRDVRAPVFPFFLFPNEGMERREAPGAGCQGPFGGPGARSAAHSRRYRSARGQ